ncbi:MAG: ABC transporter ATP-binding protein, partial [Desulfatiglandales bacterium]|nr:ABC transporter ATP-binding protein [Desulfatiglandales bacterium]
GFFSNKRSFFAENVKKVKIFKKIFSATEGERGVFQSHNSMPAMNNPTPMNREKSTDNKILEFNSITMKFGGLEALKAVSFHLQEGKVFGLIGPNGAGKTTAINVITGLYKPQEGEVIFSDENLLDVKPDKLIGIGISRTFQNVGLFEGLTVLENVMVGLHPFGKGGFFQSALKLKNARDDEAWRMARAIEMLKLVKMEGLATQVATDLPYGQQKLVALARALVSEPCLMLLDEPAAGLSRKEIEHLMSLIRTTGDKTGCTILLVEHDMDVVMGVSDHIFVLNFGVKISEGNPEQIRSDPLVVEAYLGEEEVEYYA